jgi:hypothetical protein
MPDVTGSHEKLAFQLSRANKLDELVNHFVDEAIRKSKFSLIIKPAIISFVALIISFFMDVSSIPILGNISVNLAKSLFPGWQPVQEGFEPYKFWWMPLIVYAMFIFFAYLAYEKLIVEMKRNPASETIDRVITSYTSVIDSIATALPLLGAALLLISIRMGEEIFLGLSVPFEIKALIVLALGKLFEPVLDQLGVEFQNIATHVSDLKERYFSQIQVDYSENILSQMKQVNGNGTFQKISAEELANYNDALTKLANLSSSIEQSFKNSYGILEKIKNLAALDHENVVEITAMANSLTTAAKSLSDEKTVTGLKHLESIVSKRKE